MKFVDVHSITDRVLEVIAKTPDARLREISFALVKHLHAFVREVEPTTDEFEKGCAFIVGPVSYTHLTLPTILLV